MLNLMNYQNKILLICICNELLSKQNNYAEQNVVIPGIPKIRNAEPNTSSSPININYNFHNCAITINNNNVNK